VQRHDGGVVLAPSVRDGLLRILQEAVANVVRHAEAREIEVRLSSERGRFRLTVADDGKGFEAARAFSLDAGHYGLIGMRERAERLGGRLEIESEAGQGTRVIVEVPAS
jgi:signal transduction histidine kinase